MIAQAIQAVASAFRRLAAAVSTACTGASTSQFFSTITILSLLIAIFIARIFSFPNSSSPIATNSPTNVPRTESPDLGHGNPNSPVPRFNSSAILDLAEFDEEEESLRKEVNLILEAGDVDKFLRSTDYLRWLQNYTMTVRRGPNASYRHAHPVRLDWSVRRLIYNRRRPTEEILSELLGFIGRQKKYSSCAVVDNSIIGPDADYDTTIDSHEAVIRLNNDGIGLYIPPMPRVGKKTNISFINSNILHFSSRHPYHLCHPYGDAFVLYIYKPIHFLTFAACDVACAGGLLVTEPEFDLLCTNIAKYYSLRRWFAGGGNGSVEEWRATHQGKLFHYSTTMQAMIMAVGVCERVSLFGFRKEESADPWYYTGQDGEVHDYEAEYEFYKDLMEAPERIPALSSALGKFEFPPVVIHR